GSTRIVRKVWSTTKNVFGQLWGIAEAFFQGEQVLHENEGGARRVAAMIGSWIPLIQSVSTLFQEIYKAAVGCDEVSYLNLTFATVGILLDTATLGTARLAAKSGLIVVRWLLIETAQSGAFD